VQEAGNAFGADFKGGNITLQAGKGSGAGDGGDITINTGGGISSGSVNINGNISASGDLTATTGSFGRVETNDISSSGNLIVNEITASGNISASGGITANAFYGDGSGLTNAPSTFTNITASGNISASGALIGNSLTLGGTAITSTAAEINYLDGVLSTVKNAYDGVTNVSQGNIRFTELDNGTEDLALTNLRATDSPTFEGLTLTKKDYGDIDLDVAQSHDLGGDSAGQLLVGHIPSILAGASSATYNLTSENIIATSVIMISTSALITCNATNIADGACKITFHNPTLTDFSGGNVTINIVII
jgi:hypothetical protein